MGWKTFIVGGRNVSFMAYRHSLCGVWVEASDAPGIRFSIIPFVIALVVGVVLHFVRKTLVVEVVSELLWD